MQREELFNHTLEVLTNAYQSGTLQAANCAACAVGNILADHFAYKVGKSVDGLLVWHGTTIGSSLAWYCTIKKLRGEDVYGLLAYNHFERRNIEQSLGYTFAELNEIELAFETGAITSEEDPQYAGLSAVYEVLLKLHDVEPTTVVTAKDVFQPSSEITELIKAWSELETA